MAVARFPKRLRKMLGPRTPIPRTLLSDRGPGFYHSMGTITGEYDAASRKYGFRPWAGADATRGAHAQPGDLSAVLLRETAMSWFRERLNRPSALVRKPWLLTPQDLAKRIHDVVKGINQELDVDGLCRKLPERLVELCKIKGDRLRK